MADGRSRDPLQALRSAMIVLVGCEHRDLTARQLAAFLTSYLTPDPQTVRGLATEPNLGRPVVSRVLDRLAGDHLVRRRPEPADRRSVLVKRPLVGEAAIRDLRAAMIAASRKPSGPPSAPVSSPDAGRAG